MTLRDGDSNIAGFEHERDDAERLMGMRIDIAPGKRNPYRKREDHNQRERSDDAAKLPLHKWLFNADLFLALHEDKNTNIPAQDTTFQSSLLWK